MGAYKKHWATASSKKAERGVVVSIKDKGEP